MGPRIAWILGALAVACALVTTVIQSENHARARRLSEIQRRCEMIEAANAQAEARMRAHVWGRPNLKPPTQNHVPPQRAAESSP